MIKHIILWQLKDTLSETEKLQVKKQIKEGLEGLMSRVDGMTSIHVQIECLPSSNADLMLDCTFKDQQSLDGYAVYPEHVKVKDSIIAPNVKTRVCIDYEI